MRMQLPPMFVVLCLLGTPAAAADLTGCGHIYAGYPTPEVGALEVSGPEIVGRGPLLLAGVTAPIAGDTADMEIGELWTRFEQHNQWITNAETAARTGVCLNGGEQGSFDYFAGQVLSGPAGAVPEGFATLDLPDARYAVFVLTGSAADIADAQALVHGSLLGKAGLTPANAPDLLVFPPGFRPSAPDERIELWAPIAP